MQALLDRWGYRVTLRSWAVGIVVLLGPTLRAIKPRQPPSRSWPLDFRFLLNPAFIIMQAGNVVYALGFFIPVIYLPSYAQSIGASHFEASSTLVVYNIAAFAGCVAIGWLVDRLHVTTSTTLCAAGSGVSVFLLWGLWTKLPVLFVFAVLYGLFAGSMSCSWPGIMKIVSSQTRQADPTMIIGFLAAGRGIGNIVSGPMSEALLNKGWQSSGKTLGYETEYGPLVIFTGVTVASAGMTIFGRLKPGLL